MIRIRGLIVGPTGVDAGETDPEDGAKDGGGEHLRGGAGGGGAAGLVEQEGVVGDAEGQGEVVDDQDDADAVGGEVAQQLHAGQGVAGIHGGGGLVGDEGAFGPRGAPGELRDGARQGDALLLAGAELGEGLVGALGDVGPFHGPPDEGVAGGAPLGDEAEADDLLDRVGEREGGALGDEGDPARAGSAGNAVDGASIEEDPPGAGAQATDEEAGEGGFARAVGADDRGHLSGEDLEAHPPEDGARASVGEGEILRDEGHAGSYGESAGSGGAGALPLRFALLEPYRMHEMNGRDDRGLVGVAGATGFVGRALVRELLGRGWHVRALTRSRSKAREVLPREAMEGGRLSVVEGDALGEGVADRLVAGADACVNLIGIIRETSGRQTFERAHTLTTRTLVRASERAGVGRYIQMSALGVSDEGATEYHRTKWAAERAVRASSLRWTIFRPGLIHGPEGEFMQMAKSWCEGRKAPHLFIPTFTRLDPEWSPPRPPRFEDPVVSPVRVEDVAFAFAEALEREAAAWEVYDLVGPERITMREMLTSLRDALPLGKKSLRVIGAPSEVMAIKAKVAAMVGLRDALPFDEGMAIMGGKDSVAGLDKASAHLSFAPAPYTETMRAYAASM